MKNETREITRRLKGNGAYGKPLRKRGICTLKGKRGVLGGLYCVVYQLLIKFVKKLTSYQQVMNRVINSCC